jgi:hypothetical protein
MVPMPPFIVFVGSQKTHVSEPDGRGHPLVAVTGYTRVAALWLASGGPMGDAN